MSVFKPQFLLVTCLVALFAIAVGQGQSRKKRVYPEQYYERPQDPPAENIFPRTSRGGFEVIQNFVSVQVNVNSNGLNIVGDAANEPSITVDPTNPNRLAIGWRQFNSISSNFRQGGYGYSTNRGVTWTFPGVIENGVFRSDPVLDYSPDGGLLYLSLKDTFYDDIWRSLNGGASWSRLGPATGGDKQWMVVDKTNSTGRGFIYQAWSTAGNNYGGRQFSRSTDGGFTWMDPINIPRQPYWGTTTVGQNGTLYVGGSDGIDSNFRVVRSTNAKNGGVTPTFDQSRSVNLGGEITYGVPVNPDGLGGMAWCLADPNTNNVYMLCSVDRGSQNPLDVMFSRSTDGGNTWSTAKRINDDPINQGHFHWFGTLGVAPNGRLDAIWLDTRLHSGRRMSALFYSYSMDFGATWSANIQISPTFNPNIGYPNQDKLGDYMGIVSDNTGAHVAYPATFNGEQDVYYVRIPAPNVLNPESYAIVRGIYVSGSVSDLATSNDARLAIRNQIVPSPSIPPITVSFVSQASIFSPSSFVLKFESSVSRPNVQQKLYLFNYQLGDYELVDTRQATQTDSVLTITATGDRSRFVNINNGEVRALASYLPTGPGTGLSWQARFDHLEWTILP